MGKNELERSTHRTIGKFVREGFYPDISSDSGLTLDSVLVALLSDDSPLFPGADVAGSAFPGISGGADILLATLFFSSGSLAGDFVVGVGTDPFDFLFSEGLFTLGGIFNIAASTSVSVVDASPPVSVPEPGTLVLLGLGLAGMGLARRRMLSLGGQQKLLIAVDSLGLGNTLGQSR